MKTVTDSTCDTLPLKITQLAQWNSHAWLWRACYAFKAFLGIDVAWALYCPRDFIPSSVITDAIERHGKDPVCRLASTRQSCMANQSVSDSSELRSWLADVRLHRHVE